MKKSKIQSVFLLVFALLVLVSCKEAATNEEVASTEANSSPSADYADFDKKVAAIRALFKAQSDEDLGALSEMLADTIQWSPPNYNDNKWLGKEELLATLKAYHENYDDIKYIEGLVTADSTLGGFFSGSVYPKTSANSTANVIRTYGTWTATHKESGQEVGIKFYSLSTFNEEGKFATHSDYFDINSLLPKEAED
ncbi:MAG: nuclear transport factor 2 family protein [Aurantibacter sp.]